MIDSSKIDLFKKYLNARDYAFGSDKKPAQVLNADKLLYQEVYMDLLDSCQTALDSSSLNSQLYVKPQKFSVQKGVRGHRPKTLWCAIRNLNSEDFNEMPQIYSIVSEYGVEIGFAVSIPEHDYSDLNIKIQNREIIPSIHKKLPLSGEILESLEKNITGSSDWKINASTRKTYGDKGFDAYNSVAELFSALKKQKFCRGGGSICKVIDAKTIESNPVNLVNEMEEALRIFADIQQACAPSAPDKIIQKTKKELINYSESLFDPNDMEDGRRKILKAIAQRQGQPSFRSGLMEAYESTCVITQCNVVDVLQAAHIVPYQGNETNKLDNGLLLRSDIHDLFDKHFISIEPNDLYIFVNSTLKNSEYFQYHGKKMLLPTSQIKRPSIKALEIHFNKAKEIEKI